MHGFKAKQSNTTLIKTLGTDKPWSHSLFGIDGNTQILFHKMIPTPWTGASKFITSSKT